MFLSRSASPAVRRLPVVGVLALGLMILVLGCGPDYKARAVVKGKVRSGKKDLTSGTVMFHNKNGITSTAVINTKGEYEMNDAPIGECVVTVSVPNMPMDPSVKGRLKGMTPKGTTKEESKSPDNPAMVIPQMGAMPKEIIRIDDKYANPDTSGLKYTVEKGEHTYDIDL